MILLNLAFGYLCFATAQKKGLNKIKWGILGSSITFLSSLLLAAILGIIGAVIGTIVSSVIIYVILSRKESVVESPMTSMNESESEEVEIEYI